MIYQSSKKNFIVNFFIIKYIIFNFPIKILWNLYIKIINYKIFILILIHEVTINIANLFIFIITKIHYLNYHYPENLQTSHYLNWFIIHEFINHN
jgi:hypothetical protein